MGHHQTQQGIVFTVYISTFIDHTTLSHNTHTHAHTHTHTHTQDDEVKLTIEKAMRGEIEVGSYKLPLRSNELPEEGVTQNVEPLKGIPHDDTSGHVESSAITIQRKPKGGA